MNIYKVFHSGSEKVRQKVDIALVRPENSANVGSVARAMANMGINGALHLINPQCQLDEKSRALAKHAKERLEKARIWPSLPALLKAERAEMPLSLAATARVGSSTRPHPLWIRDAAPRALTKLELGDYQKLLLVFGPEGDGLSNDEVEACDWVVTIPSSDEYRSLNLAQAVLIFCYEVNLALTEQWGQFERSKPTQKQKLVFHFLKLAEATGFVLPGDPFKMRPRLEQILSHLPNHIPEVNTLHGLLDQAIRSATKGMPDFKGRYLRKVQSELKE